MKRLLLTLFATLWATALFANDRIEVGSFRTLGGQTILCTYVIRNNATTEVDLFFPDGHQTSIAVTPGTSPATIDKSIHRFAETELQKTPVCTP
jgi:hypothetical protein